MLGEAFYQREGDVFVATEMTRGPWDDEFQHGGPPAALLAQVIQNLGANHDEYRVTRMTVELLKPVPIAPVRVELGSVTGRSVQRVEATLAVEGTTVMVARALRIRRKKVQVPNVPAPAPWPEPDTLQDFVFPFFRNDVGYHRAVQLKVARGVWGETPVGIWAKPRIPLVAGELTTPLENLIILADAQSGMGIPLDPAHYTFLNPDLTVYIERTPDTGWLGFDIRSTANTDGAGLSQSAVRDARGLVARTAQSLIVAKRSD